MTVRIFIMLFFSAVSMIGQNEPLRGVVMGFHSKEPVKYANIQVLNSKLGTSSNSHGDFQLASKRNNWGDLDTLKISCIGYATQKVSVVALASNDTIWLHQKSIELAELKVYKGMNANDIVRMAMGGLSKKCNKQPYSMNVFYRHYCSEEGIYGRLIEAALILQDQKGHRKRCVEPKDKIGVEVQEIRSSYDFTKNFDEHDPISIYGTLKYDITSYDSYLHYYPEEFNFQLLDTLYYDNTLVWSIGYEYTQVKNRHGDTLRFNCTGLMHINSKDFGILEIQEYQEHAIEKTFETNSYWMLWNVKYQNYDGQYYLKYVSEEGQNIDEARGTNQEIVSRKDHFFKVEMMVNEIVLTTEEQLPRKEPTKEELEAMKYHPDFWQFYTVLENSPLNNTVVQHLEKRQRLEDQFQKE